MTGFSTFGLSEAMLKKLETINFTTPTPIQEQSIPAAMEGKDILGTAQTGTGKTAAFGLPLVHHLLNKPHSMALVMTPTRELAVQVMTQIKSFLPDGSGIKTALLIGGEAMFKQLNQLQSKPRIIIGTPGRINDHLERDTLRLSKTDFLVLDEADRMLDMGFGVQLEAIAEYLPETRQTLMFSATVPANIMKLAKNYLKDPVRVETAAPHLAAPKIKQELIHVNDDTKHDELIKLLDARSGQIIVFVKTKHGADRLARRLTRENHSADTIHGDLRQGQRDRVIRGFRKNDTRILVATDVAARGLDIPMLETVINYDLPQCPEDYIHRIGRTGRNGQEGEAICLISGADKAKWAAIDRLMNPGKAKAEGGFERSGGRGGNSRGGPKRSFGGNGGGGRNYGPKASFGERKFGEKPSWKSSFKKDERSDRPSRDFGDRNDRPARFERDDRAEGSGRKPWSPEGAYNNENRSEGRSFSGGRSSEGRSFGDRSERSSAPRKEWIPEAEFRKQRDGGNAGKPAFKKEWSKDAPRGESRGEGRGEARRDGHRSDAPRGHDAPRKEWGTKDGAAKKPFSRDGEKPAFKKSEGKKDFGFKKEGGFKKSSGSKPFASKSNGGNSAPRRPRSVA